MNSKITLLIILLSFIGFLDSAYLTANHFSNTTLPCFISEGCELVTNSQYSKIGLIPLSLIGLFYYLFSFFMAISYIKDNRQIIKKLFLAISTLAFVFSVWLVYLQFFVLASICSYCMVSAITSTLLFLSGIIWLKTKPA